MSLRAIYRTLQTHARSRAAELALMARAAALGSAAKWDKKHAALFNGLLQRLEEVANPAPAPKQISRGELLALFGALGVKPEAPASA